MTIPSHSLARLAFGACCMQFFIQSLCLSETVAVAGLWCLILSDSISLSDPTILAEKMRPLRLLIFVKPHWNWYRRAEAQNPWENCMPYCAIVRNRTRIGRREPNACIFCILFRMQLDGTSAQMEKSPWRAFWYLLHMQDDIFFYVAPILSLHFDFYSTFFEFQDGCLSSALRFLTKSFCFCFRLNTMSAQSCIRPVWIWRWTCDDTS